uniref:Uncharacterized protein n=1 Tax=Anguilla anguilla TaxID=7936 RepID=A0A0E9VF50_ANGAN
MVPCTLSASFAFMLPRGHTPQTSYRLLLWLLKGVRHGKCSNLTMCFSQAKPQRKPVHFVVI